MPNWLQKILRWEPGISLSQWIIDTTIRLWPWLVSIGGATALVALSSVTEWLRALGPAGIFGAAVVFVLVTTIGINLARSLSAGSRLKRAQRDAIEKWKEDVDNVNPLDNEFHHKRIRLTDLAHPITHKISGKRFTDCELLGPAVLLISGAKFYGMGIFDCDVVVLNHKVNVPIYNAITITDSEVSHGTLWNCTLLIHPENVKTFVKMGARFMTFTGVQEIDSPKPTEAV